MFQRGEPSCTAPNFRSRDYYLATNSTNPIFTTYIKGDSNLDVLFIDTFYSSILNLNVRVVKILYGDVTSNLNDGPSLMIDFVYQPNLQLIVDKDFNNDKKKDLLAIDSSSGKVFAFLGDGTGMFTKKISDINFIPNYTNQASPPIADLDADGLPDLISYGGTYTPSVNVALNNGDGTFTLPYTLNFNSNSIIGIGDFKGDGMVDVVANGLSGETTPIVVFPGDRIGSFGAPLTSSATLEGSLSNANSIVLGDFISDGNLDIAFVVNRYDNGSYMPSIGIIAGKSL